MPSSSRIRPAVGILSAKLAACFALAGLAGGAAATAPASAPANLAPIDFAAMASPILLQGDANTAYRDPAAVYHDGVFHLFFTLVRKDDDGQPSMFVAVSTSPDLTHWTPPRTLTPKDRRLNFCSPGSVVRFQDQWVMCMSSYPRPNGEKYGNADARLWVMRSADLETWSAPEILRVKGENVPVEKMGRMIDAYIFQDKDDAGKWWCFYKQKGVSMSYSRDLKTWTPFGRTKGGENSCVVVDGNEYVLFHSPQNGIGVKRSGDLKEWRDVGLLTLGQNDWPWARGRLTAGFVMDLRREKRVGKYLMFFHGSGPEDEKTMFDNFASLGLAFSDDLVTWHWAGEDGRRQAEGNRQ